MLATCHLTRTHWTPRRPKQLTWSSAPLVYLLPPYSQNGTVPSFWARYGGLNEYLYSNRLCTPMALGFTLASAWFCAIIMQNMARNLQIVGSSNFDPVACIFHSLTAPLLLSCSTNNTRRVVVLHNSANPSPSVIESYRLQLCGANCARNTQKKQCCLYQFVLCVETFIFLYWSLNSVVCFTVKKYQLRI